MYKVTKATTGYNWVRIGNVQICWGRVDIEIGIEGKRSYYPMSFADKPYVACTAEYRNDVSTTCTIGDISADFVDLYLFDRSMGITQVRSAHWLAIGRWR